MRKLIKFNAFLCSHYHSFCFTTNKGLTIDRNNIAILIYRCKYYFLLSKWDLKEFYYPTYHQINIPNINILNSLKVVLFF